MSELLWGRFANKRASLSLSCNKIELEPGVGEICQGAISYISDREDEAAYGVVVTDHDRMKVSPENLKGGTGVIKYEFDTAGLLEGTAITGNITFITNCGEYIIPYSVKMFPAYPDSSMGKIKNLYHFTKLARESWQEAISVFRSELFPNILKDGDSYARSFHRKLAETWDASQGMEEFLCAVKKKEHIGFVTSRDAGIDISVLTEEELPVPLEIQRKGWGYTRIRIRTAGDFIRVEKENISDSDFYGNTCKTTIFLVKKGLKNGFGRGKIILEGPYTNIEIPVCVGRMQPMIKRRRREYTEKVSRFYRLYIDYVLGKCSKRDWMDETEDLLSALRLFGKENVVWDLMRIHLLLTRERYGEAKNFLDKYYEGALFVESGTDIGCYYLYLNSLVKRDPDYTREVTFKIRETLESEPSRFYVAWLLMYLDEDFAANPHKAFLLLNNQYDYGNCSPLLMLEAAELILEHPDFLMKYSSFAVEVLIFLAKNHALTADLAQQATYLAEHMKSTDKRMIRVLFECYEILGDDVVLKAICSLLIQSGRTDKEALVWYRMAIRREILLTSLYEYYMLSVDINGKEDILPAALEYFSYSCELPFERKAFLYNFLISNKYRYEDVYAASLSSIEDSLVEWVSRDMINENVARIFMDQWNRNGDIRDRLSPHLDVLFTHKVTPGDETIKRFHVVDERHRRDREYSLSGDSSYIGIYVETAMVIFEDPRGFRYVDPIGSSVAPIFSGRDVARVISERINPTPQALSDNVLLALWGAGTGGGLVTASNLKNALELYTRPSITDTFKGDLAARLIQYLDVEDSDQSLLERLIYGVSGDIIPSRDRNDLIIIMIKRGFFHLAVTWMEEFGWEHLPPNWAFFLVNHMHRDSLYSASPILMPLTLKAYRDKKYNEDMLRYLAENYLTGIKGMTELWKSCSDFDVRDIFLGERVLLQMAFTQNFTPEVEPILVEHIEAGGQAPSYVEAIRYLCHRHMVRDKELPDIVKRELLRRYWQNSKLAVIERVVILKILSEDSLIDDNADEIINDLLPVTMYRDEVVFGFFEKIGSRMDFKPYDDGKVYLSFMTDKEADIDIHYMRYLGDGSGEYQVENMHSPCPGIYTRMFPMFPGEKMKYYLTRKDSAGEDELIKEGILSSPLHGDGEVLVDPNSITGRYNAIEGIARAIDKGNAKLAEESIKAYYIKDTAVRELFKLL